ncbi:MULTISPECIES: hypothetical protein [Bacillus]|uniref:hypothetical protein n=1 Tax=Bacillus TaxID=1386 RepID=UPI002FFED8EF
MAPKISAATSVRGVVAYQDDQDSSVFHYYPQNAVCKLNENLAEFNVTYWGIGEAYYARVGEKYFDSIGATLSGKATIDLTSEQRTQIIDQIKKDYEIADPKLQPILLTDVRVKPYFEKALMIEGGDKNFPDTIQFGTAFHYQLGCPQNSVFASYVATESESGINPNPSFAITMEAKAEFLGDPWIVKASADLSQVWSYIKQKFSGRGSVGWFTVASLDFQQTIIEMERDKILKLEFTEGSLDTETYGRQIFELGKTLFTSLDTQGDFFKFEPVPNIEEVNVTGVFSWGWNVSINASYMTIDIKQNIHFEQTISYTGRFKLDIPASMTLAVNCNEQTAMYFKDLAVTNQPCITQKKIDTLQARLKIEAERQERLIKKLQESYVTGAIDDEGFRKRYRIITGKDPMPSLMTIKSQSIHGITYSEALVGIDSLET